MIIFTTVFIDFMNLGFEKAGKIIENASWYPVKETALGK